MKPRETFKPYKSEQTTGTKANQNPTKGHDLPTSHIVTPPSNK